MMVLLGTVLVLLALSLGSADDVTDGTELVFSFMVHRHGDRTPVPNLYNITGDQAERLAEMIDHWGYGQLTDTGKRTAYKTGQFIRRRYNDLLSDRYNYAEIFIRSTDSTRTKMSVLTAMAAVFPPRVDNWNNHIHWTPTPYTTVPVILDYNLAFFNCPAFVDGLSAILTSNTHRMDAYRALVDRVSTITGFDIRAMPVLIYPIFDIYTSMLHLGLELDHGIMTVWRQLTAAADKAIDIAFGDEKYIAYQAGVLLNEFFTYANQVMNGTKTPRVRVYSAHDFNVYSLQAVTQVPRQGVPKYGALYSLELRRIRETGEYVVLPVYFSPDERERYLQVSGCDILCPIDQFTEITSSFVLEEDEWKSRCGFKPDLKFDTSGFD